MGNDKQILLLEDQMIWITFGTGSADVLWLPINMQLPFQDMQFKNVL